MLSNFPKYFTSKAITLYLLVLVTVNIIFISHPLSFIWWIFGAVEALSFFYFSNVLTTKWAEISEKNFESNLFVTGLIIRVVWVFFAYFFYMAMTGAPYEFGAADVYGYQWMGESLATQGFSNYDAIFSKYEMADRGYGTYLGLIYMIFGNGVIIPRLIKAVLGAFAAVLIYRLAKRNFGEAAGRIAGIFYLLMPNLIYYTGSHLKEAEMVFLVVLYIERADYVIRSKSYNFINIAIPLIISGALFFLRTALGAAALFSFFTAILFTSKRILSYGKRTVLVIWIVGAIAYLAGGRVATEIEKVWQDRTTNQKSSMDYRANIQGGNKFAKYFTGAIFAPMIFVIPVPTMVGTEGQENQQLIHGGNYVKDILAFFVILSLVIIIKEKKWRDHLLMGSFMLGYLGVIAMSAFAQSERFHQPALPFILVFAAYGLSNMDNKNKKYYTWWIVFMFFVIVGWNWFKLAGRGLV